MRWRRQELSWAQSELTTPLKYFLLATHRPERRKDFEGIKTPWAHMATAVCSVSPIEGGVLLPIPPDHQCCLSTEEEWPSLLGAAVTMWCNFHGLSHQELQGLRLQDCFVVKFLRYKKIRMWNLYYQRTKVAHQSFDFWQPPSCLYSFICPLCYHI